MFTGRQYEFGHYRLDTQGRLLFRNGERMALTPKVVDLLIVLVEANGEVVGRDELLRRVWPGTVVEEGSVTSHISVLRKALREGKTEQQYIETLPKRGYRFVGSVKDARTVTAGDAADRRVLVVLPFENLSGGGKHDYFSDGLTEELITQLARLSPDRLGVIARTSAMQYKSTTKTVRQIGGELGASHVLEGGVRRAGDRLRITAQLIRVSDESHLWAECYERKPHDILALQAEVTRAIAREIRITLTVREQKRLDLDRFRSIDPQAHELYLRGRHFWNRRTEDGMRKSIQCFEQAVQHEPNYAAAYDGISDAYTMLACRGVIPAAEALHRAKTAARQAVQLEPELGEGYASLAHVRLHDWDWVGLAEDFRRALDLNPGHLIAHYWYAEYLMAMGQCDEAVATVKRAQQMDPVNSLFNASVGMILYLAQRYDEAIAVLRQALEIDPSLFLIHLRLGLAYQQKKLPREAIAEMQQAVSLSGRSTETLAGLAQAYAAAGDRKAMQEIVDELLGAGKPYVSPYNVARIYGSLADKQRAFDWLERAYDEHNPDLIELTREPSFASLRADSKFHDLARRIGWSTAD